MRVKAYHTKLSDMKASLVEATKFLKRQINQGVAKRADSGSTRANAELFHEDCGLGIGPGIANISPGWFPMGHDYDVSLQIYLNCHCLTEIEMDTVAV